MKKIYKLKQWFSISDTAKRLTQTLSETVEESDLLELALDGHIQLHWYLRHVPAIKVELTSREIPFRLDENFELQVNKIDGKAVYTHDYFPVDENAQVSFLDGAHILLLTECGALLDYLRSFLTETGGELVSIDGFYVKDSEGRVWNIRQRFEKEQIDRWEKDGERRSYYGAQNYFPTNAWPEYSELGFTKEELEKFEGSLNRREAKEIITKERTTLLKMLIGMAIDGYGYDHKASRSPFPKELEGVLDRHGISVSDDTIRKWLKEAVEYLPQNTDNE